MIETAVLHSLGNPYSEFDHLFHLISHSFKKIVIIRSVVVFNSRTFVCSVSKSYVAKFCHIVHKLRSSDHPGTGQNFSINQLKGCIMFGSSFLIQCLAPYECPPAVFFSILNLSLAITNLLEDNLLRERLGKKAREEILTNWRSEERVEDFVGPITEKWGAADALAGEMVESVDAAQIGEDLLNINWRNLPTKKGQDVVRKAIGRKIEELASK